MKKQLVLLALFVGLAAAALAQNLNYGLQTAMNIPSVKNDEVNYSVNIGFGLGMYADYQLHNPKLKGLASLGYNNLSYSVDQKNTKIITNNTSLFLGVKYSPSFLDNSSILLGHSANYALGAQSVFQGTNNPGPREVNIASKLENRLTSNLSFGIEFDLKSNTSLVAMYSYAFNKNYTVEYIDAQPNFLSLGLAISLAKSSGRVTDREKMVQGLKSLSEDTLYFVNNSCDGELTNTQLDSILRIHYTFSAFKVIENSEIKNVQKQPNTLNFAFVGAHYSSLDDIPSSGIFLLDKNLRNLDYPYPHFVRLEFDFGNNRKLCLYSLENVSILVDRLNEELSAAYASSAKE